jgi:hypothetical protein
MGEKLRDPGAILDESAPALALVATGLIYAEQPALWEFGDHGRERTVEDFCHHFRALASMDVDVVAAHVRYCQDLFRERGFPRRWLGDAWRTMETTLHREMPSHAEEITSVLRAGVEAARAS